MGDQVTQLPVRKLLDDHGTSDRGRLIGGRFVGGCSQVPSGAAIRAFTEWAVIPEYWRFIAKFGSSLVRIWSEALRKKRETSSSTRARTKALGGIRYARP